MDRDKILIFVDHVGRFYAQRYGFSPVTGRLIGYLSVCEPMEQSINDIAEALLTSRSAISNAVKMLETQNLIHRLRPAGTRADLISLSPLNSKNMGFDPSEYRELASLAREGLGLLHRPNGGRHLSLPYRSMNFWLKSYRSYTRNGTNIIKIANNKEGA
jgi:MarR family